MTSPALRVSASATPSMVSAGSVFSTPRSEADTFQRRVGDQDATVRAHRQSLADRVPGALGAHRDEDHLPPVRLLELEPLFDAALVAGVEDHLLLARDGVVSLEGKGGVGIRNLLDGDDDLQSSRPNYRWAENAAWNRSRSDCVLRLSNCAGSSPSSQVTSR